jgi:hypothetical protein
MQPKTDSSIPVAIYQSADGLIATEVKLQDETVWLTQRQMGELFASTAENVLMHLKNIYQDGELAESATTKDFLVVQQEGTRQVRRSLKHYNLDAIISVGYRVNSRKGTQFRIWATNVLRQHLVQGYTVHERRLKELNQAVRLIADVAQRRTLSGDEANALAGRGIGPCPS